MGAFAMNLAKCSWDRRVSAPVTTLIFAFMTVVFAAPANAAGTIDGRVLGAGTPIANSTITLWAASAGTSDGNDNIWISNFAGAQSPIVELCGARTQNCPPGMSTGDQISPPGGRRSGLRDHIDGVGNSPLVQ
jgi:hypothetical protein